LLRFAEDPIKADNIVMAESDRHTAIADVVACGDEAEPRGRWRKVAQTGMSAKAGPPSASDPKPTYALLESGHSKSISTTREASERHRDNDPGG
jgi:hypothetical protein